MGKLQLDDLTGVEKRVRDGVGVERAEGQQAKWMSALGMGRQPAVCVAKAATPDGLVQLYEPRP